MSNFTVISSASSLRRQFLTLIGGSALTALPSFPVFASLPIKKDPTPLEDLITRLTLAIYTGRLSRQVWMPEELAKKLYTEGAKIDPSELRLLNRSEIDMDRPSTGFFEIDNAKPLLKNPNAITMPLYRGRIYCGGYSQRDEIVEAEKFVGRDVIFLFDGFMRLGKGETTFPEPYYARVGDGHWRDGLPIPMSRLKDALSIGKRAGFVVPTERNSSMPSAIR